MDFIISASTAGKIAKLIRDVTILDKEGDLTDDKVKKLAQELGLKEKNYQSILNQVLDKSKNVPTRTVKPVDPEKVVAGVEKGLKTGLTVQLQDFTKSLPSNATNLTNSSVTKDVIGPLNTLKVPPISTTQPVQVVPKKALLSSVADVLFYMKLGTGLIVAILIICDVFLNTNWFKFMLRRTQKKIYSLISKFNEQFIKPNDIEFFNLAQFKRMKTNFFPLVKKPKKKVSVKALQRQIEEAEVIVEPEYSPKIGDEGPYENVDDEDQE